VSENARGLLETAGPSHAIKENEEMSKRLYVGNLSYNTTEMGLREVFAKAGEVTEVKMVLDRETGRPRGFAFVEMATDQAAQQAVTDLDGRDLDGRTLKVNPAQERSEGGRSGGGRARW
jgi:RNA recognition motif-containing protein